jgi:hypothetical protein
LSIYLGQRSLFQLGEDSKQDHDPILLAPEILRRMIRARGGLSDDVIRPTLRLVHDQPQAECLLAAMQDGVLMVDAEEFKAWYRTERSRGIWPSQVGKSVKRGRPTKQTEGLRSKIGAITDENRWRPSDGFPALRALLQIDGILASADTLRRLIDQMFLESGDPRLRRSKRPSTRATAPTAA